MKKTYVIDTNVLIQAPYALESFEDNDIVVPMATLEGVDELQSAKGESGSNARQVVRYLETLRLRGNLSAGIPLSSGGTITLEPDPTELGAVEKEHTARIIETTSWIKERMDGQQPVILVTNNIVTRIKAQASGIAAEEFTTDNAAEGVTYSGRGEYYIPTELTDEFKQHGVSVEDIYAADDNGQKNTDIKLTENQFVTLYSDTCTEKTLLGIHRSGHIIPLRYSNIHPFGATPRNVGQYFMQEALMLPVDEAPLVIIKGPAGTAKTFYAMATGLEQTVEMRPARYRKILVCRPNSQFDTDIGFLPGSEQDKISPLLRPIMDNLEVLFTLGRKAKVSSDKMDMQHNIRYLFDTGIICAEALNYMRGRSISDTWLVVDEAQNLTPRQVKGLITRVSIGTKVILIGDPQQIDNPLLTEYTNGLSYAAARMKGSSLCVQISMLPSECERSILALDAAARM